MSNFNWNTSRSCFVIICPLYDPDLQIISLTFDTAVHPSRQGRSHDHRYLNERQLDLPFAIKRGSIKVMNSKRYKDEALELPVTTCDWNRRSDFEIGELIDKNRTCELYNAWVGEVLSLYSSRKPSGLIFSPFPLLCIYLCVFKPKCSKYSKVQESSPGVQSRNLAYKWLSESVTRAGKRTSGTNTEAWTLTLRSSSSKLSIDYKYHTRFVITHSSLDLGSTWRHLLSDKA